MISNTNGYPTQLIPLIFVSYLKALLDRIWCAFSISNRHKKIRFENTYIYFKACLFVSYTPVFKKSNFISLIYLLYFRLETILNDKIKEITYFTNRVMRGLPCW